MSDPQEVATPSDPHSAEAEEREAWAAFVAGHASRDAEVAELRAEKERWHDAALIGLAQESAAQAEVAELKAERDGLLQLREVAHWECDCVPDLGPTHCHACGDAAGHPVAWADSTHGPSTEVAELKAKIADAWDEGLSAGCDRWADSREFGDPPINPYRSASSPVEGGN